MTYGELKQRALQLAFSCSLAGTEIPETYNTQADYLAMIPGLVNAAQMQIASRELRIPRVRSVSELTHERVGDWEVYSLPEDCWQLMSGGLLNISRDGCRNGVRERYAGFRIGLGKKLCLPPGFPAENYLLEYWRYPLRVTADTPDETELDNEPEAQECLPYYVAYGILLYDDPYRAQNFRAEFETRVSRLREQLWLEEEPVRDVYHSDAASCL